VRLAERIVAAELGSAGLRSPADSTATEVLLFHAPVAGHLRTVVAACSVPKRLPGPVAWRFSAAQAIRRYSLITPPRTRFRRIGASSGMTVAGSWFGGRWSRPWCGR
jgi:hypothetical protein